MPTLRSFSSANPPSPIQACKEKTKVDNRKRTTCIPDIPGRRPIYGGGSNRETGRNGKKPLIPIWERPKDEESAEREDAVRGGGDGGGDAVVSPPVAGAGGKGG